MILHQPLVLDRWLLCRWNISNVVQPAMPAIQLWWVLCTAIHLWWVLCTAIHLWWVLCTAIQLWWVLMIYYCKAINNRRYIKIQNSWQDKGWTVSKKTLNIFKVMQGLPVFYTPPPSKAVQQQCWYGISRHHCCQYQQLFYIHSAICNCLWSTFLLKKEVQTFTNFSNISLVPGNNCRPCGATNTASSCPFPALWWFILNDSWLQQELFSHREPFDILGTTWSIRIFNSE